MRVFFIMLAVAAMVLASTAGTAAERANRVGYRFARTMPWNGNYAHTSYGAPLGLVVPPIAEMQTKMGWGVSQSEMVPIYHQVQRSDWGGYGGSGYYLPTPYWPSHTDQFGVYYIRGPW